MTSSARRIAACWSSLAAAACSVSLALAGTPHVCNGTAGSADWGRAPQIFGSYLDSLGDGHFDLRSACAMWAGMFSKRHRSLLNGAATTNPLPARLILFPAPGFEVSDVIQWLGRDAHVRSIERARNFVIAEFSRRTPSTRFRELLIAPQIEYLEPDCDGPDFLTTSLESNLPPQSSDCWTRAARAGFPNDPCMEELWGHALIGWDSAVAARSLPRLVAVLDSGIDAEHEDLGWDAVLHVAARGDAPGSAADRVNARCATSGRCYSHGTEMAGTIGGRMDNGIGVAGVAPNSQLLPIVISKVDRGLLGRISTIAEGIQSAALDGADIINISAKWPVDSRAISDAVRTAVGGSAAGRRLLVTGYATSLDYDDTVREYFPSQYRCLPGVLAAVPADMRGHDLFNPTTRPNANDGRIQAPGVDIVVTTNENSERGYALSGAAGASSAAAYVSGVVALVWGSPPLNTCDAQQIKRLLFCRSKTSDSTRYPWIHVDFLRELAKLDPGADCRAAMAALGCD